MLEVNVLEHRLFSLCFPCFPFSVAVFLVDSLFWSNVFPFFVCVSDVLCGLETLNRYSRGINMDGLSMLVTGKKPLALMLSVQ